MKARSLSRVSLLLLVVLVLAPATIAFAAQGPLIPMKDFFRNPEKAVLGSRRTASTSPSSCRAEPNERTRAEDR